VQENFSGRIANFFNSWHANSSRTQAYKNLFAQEFLPMYATVRWVTKLFRKNRIPFSARREVCAAQITRSDAERISAILLLPFAVICR
jgi:hypothetical protein